MERVIVFNLLQLLVSSYAVIRGGAPEKITGASLLIATIITHFVQHAMPSRFVGIESGVMLVDLLLLVVLLVVSLYADRFWPFWLVTFHAIGTGAHLVRAADQEVLRMAYAVMTAAWAYPMMLVLALGTARHVRRMRAEGRDLDWSCRARS
ncbi:MULTISPECIES: hypothetical protein [unclassified Sphingomonas]|uniref:hypothetical protein n=1 Tax=unclassified Sphingomonas TaxID=196159 RepID=UPI00226ADC59|nr:MULTISPECIES: hypothetical protein [unclassified Sphingomonas]